MYNTQKAVGDFFENRVIQLFDLQRSGGELPDLTSRKRKFFMEVKASAYTNGGVINQGQIQRFNQEINIRRFYAFAYHSIGKNMGRSYATREALEADLDLRSLYIFPFSIVFSYFNASDKRRTPFHDTFVLMREKTAEKIFLEDAETWKKLELKTEDYKMIQPHKRVFIITRQGNLEQELLNSFRPGAIC